MSDTRKNDREPRAWFRSRRFYMNGGKWYFNTREGTEEGPFGDLQDAENRLKEYINITNSGFMPSDSMLGLVPLEEGHKG